MFILLTSFSFLCVFFLFFTQQAANGVVNPKVLSAANVQFTRFDEVDKGGEVIGSNIRLQSGGKAYINAGMHGMDKQTCTILFNSTGFDQLILSVRYVPITHKNSNDNDNCFSEAHFQWL